MSLMPNEAPGPSAESFPSQDAVPPPLPHRNLGRLLAGISFAIFTLGVGLFLMIFPWMDIWNLNYLQGLVPALQDVWDDPYFRGAVTGLGLVNIYLAGLEVARLKKAK